MPDPGDITRALRSSQKGDRTAGAQLYQLVYDELRRIAARQRSRHARPSSDLDTTALVHEAFLKFQRVDTPDFEDREHFYAVAAQAMRQLLVDQARKEQRKRRGGGDVPVPFEEVENLRPANLGTTNHSILELDAALEDLGRQNARALQVALCKIFADMSEQEIARVVDANVRTIRRDWATARAWLALRLSPSA